MWMALVCTLCSPAGTPLLQSVAVSGVRMLDTIFSSVVLLVLPTLCFAGAEKIIQQATRTIPTDDWCRAQKLGTALRNAEARVIIVKCSFRLSLEIVIDQKTTVVVGLEPMVQVNLIEVRSDDLFSQFVSLAAQERNPQPG
jgi:hypothetical protein